MAQPFPPKPPNKPGLGRGLQDLLGKPASPEPREDLFEPPLAEAAPEPNLSAGFSTLLRANQNQPKPESATPRDEASPVLLISLVSADVFLAAVACWLAFTPHPTAWTWVFCGLALALGAWLSVLALWHHSGQS